MSRDDSEGPPQKLNLAKGPPSPAAGSRPGREGGLRDTNRKARRDSLHDAALPLFLTRGIAGVAIEDITREAGIAKGSFYRYFPDKEALVASLFAEVGEGVRGALRDCARRLEEARDSASLFQAYRALAEDLSVSLLTRPDLVRLYLQEARGPDEGARRPVRALSRQVAEGAEILTAAAHRHGLLRDLPPGVSSLAVVGAVERLLFAFLSEEVNLSVFEVPQALISLVLDGIRAR